MERREALNKIGLSLGTVTVSPTILSLLQSCTTTEMWEPKFFSKDEAMLIEKTLEVMLPPSLNVPGAGELNLAQFIDAYISVISFEREQNQLRSGVSRYIKAILDNAGKKKIADLNSDDIDERLAYYLKAEKTQQDNWAEETRNTPGNSSDDATVYGFLRSLRNRGIYAFKITEQIGEGVLAYDPVPGKQEGCVDLQEVTQGKAWSL